MAGCPIFRIMGVSLVMIAATHGHGIAQSVADPKLEEAKKAFAAARNDVERADALLRMGGEQMLVLDNLAAAQSSFQKCVDMLRPSSRTSAQSQLYLVKCLGELGLVRNLQHNTKDALSIRQEQVSIARRVLPALRDPSEWQDLLLSSLEDLTLTYFDLGDNRAASSSASDAVQTAREIAAQRPDSGRAQYRLTETLGLQGKAMVLLSDSAGAEKCFNENLQILEPLAAANPNWFEANYDYIQMLIWKGENSRDTTFFQKALDLALAMQRSGILPGQDYNLIANLKKRLNQK
jgi:hypothetical protein